MTKRTIYKFASVIAISCLLFSNINSKALCSEKSSGYIIEFSSSKSLVKENISSLDLKLLNLARNEIFARHGYVFKDQELSNYFTSKKWYKMDKKYSGKLSAIEKKNIDLIKTYEKYLTSAKYNNDLNNDIRKNNAVTRESNFDLNGDGKLETIKLSFEKPSDAGFVKYVLKINNKIITGTGESLEPRFNIVDIDLKDNIKEISIQEYGPSDDCLTTFYYYDGKNIINIGKLQGLCGSYKRIVGKGIVLANTRFKVLQTWFYDDEFKLGAGHRLQHLAKEFYKTNYKYPVTMLKPLTIYKSNKNKSVVSRLKVGEKVELIGSDDKTWCLLKTKNEQIGWFELNSFGYIKEHNMDGSNVFNGLCQAD